MKIIGRSKTMLKAKTEKTHTDTAQFRRPHHVRSMVHSVQYLLAAAAG